jgi:hypothetical protein
MENYFEEVFCSLFSDFLMKIENAGITCGEYYADCLTIQAMANRGYTEEELASRLSLSSFELRRALDRNEWLDKLLKK